MDDVDDDGLFGAGDTLLLHEGDEGYLTQETLMSFSATLYCDVQVDVGVEAWVHAGTFGLASVE